jgi:tripartite ATP-independent transporter DctP family solute receptor
MTRFTRRTVVSGAAATFAGFGLPLRHARAAEFSFKVATDQPDAHPLNIHLRRAAELVARDTNGRMELKIFSNNVLGGQSDVFTQLRQGAVEVFLLSGVNVLSQLIPGTALHGLGFIFKDYDQVWAAMDGEVGAHLRGLIEKGGIVVLDKVWDNGFRQITSSVKPITQPSDLRGMKIRVPISALWTSLFQSLGAAPTSLNFAEVYSALQTKVVDGQENPPAIIDAAKLYEVQKYCSVTNHMWDGWWFLINRRVWGTVPADIKDVVAKHMNTQVMEQRKDVARVNGSLREELSKRGLVFNDVDTAPFKEELRKAGFYTEWRKRFGEDAIAKLEKVTGPLG